MEEFNIKVYVVYRANAFYFRLTQSYVAKQQVCFWNEPLRINARHHNIVTIVSYLLVVIYFNQNLLKKEYF